MTRERRIVGRINNILAAHGCSLFGFADLEGIVSGELTVFPRAVSLALAMDRSIMVSIENGPNQAYAALYAETNKRLNALCAELARTITAAGHQAWAVPASVRSDPVGMKGDFPHKTAATRAGMGWVGKNAQLITRERGPWLRLGTVLTDAPLPAADPVKKSYCGKCTACVEACPAGALKGGDWYPGLPRSELLDVRACDEYKKTHFYEFHKGHNCGICTNACPWGRKLMKTLGEASV